MANIVKKTIFLLFLLRTHAGIGAELPEFFTPIGPMGAGGAFTAVANDENAIWTNPAGIARSRKARSRNKMHITKFPGLFAGANTESRSFYSALKSGTGSSSEAVAANPDKISTKPFWTRFGIFPVSIFEFAKNRPAAFGLFLNNRSSARISSDDAERAAVESISDVGAVIGLSFANPSNNFSLGISLRPTYRYAFEDKVDIGILMDRKSFTDLLKDRSNVSSGLGIDVGMIYTYPDFWYPTIGISILNLPTGCKENYLNPFSEVRETVCGNVYSGKFSNEEALSTVDPTDLRVGLSIAPRLSRTLALRLSMDMHHIYLTDGSQSYGLSEIEPIKTLHAGLEVIFGNPLVLGPISLRAGINKGFVTAGFSLRSDYFSLEFASYGEDISSSAKSREDRRMLASLSFDF